MNPHESQGPAGAPPPVVLSVENLSVGVRTGRSPVPVLDRVAFEVRAGETVCVVGESGSGKSVTSLTVMGLLPKDALAATGGRILVDGEDVLRASPARLRELRATRMAMVFQEPMTALNPVQRVGDQIDEVLRLHSGLGRAQRREKVLAMLEAVHLPDVRRIHDAYPHQLSGGQRQRIVIAMALILEPRLLIADEPTTALDVTTQRQILLLIRELQQKHGTAVLFITHDFGVVSEIADRIVVMNRGRLVEQGTRDEVLARPREDYTRMLIASVPSLVPRAARPRRAEVVLEVSGLDKTYTERRLFGPDRVVAAASDVNFTIARGEILGVVGESGSGKSTVARCVVRLIDPSAGAVRLKGRDIATVKRDALRPLRKHIQIVFQDPYRSLNPRRRIGESIIEGLLNNGVPRPDALEKARALLVMVGLPADAMHRYPHQFSGGQRQRICIARALALEPDILVADEAVSALDVSVQAQVLALLEEIRERTGVAVLFITHDLRVAAQICDTIVVMKKGRIVESGPTATVLATPREAYTRELIEAAPGRDWDFQNFRPLAKAPPSLAIA
ncbi:ABC transporter ATP-binding protein [Piscinibacter sakaiensis]|uniref:Oligopeptide transport ATP-binding protein OppD n=1 Tax=Piscinibacter sakaiensis TaxID=1547922 RepID=A0A0K8NYC0_PISS1|nr:ABC transporter ATP-binding protein [Piscinibacter sakaiensis]GAP35402.1 oligopeptide transport ATP-binding protein OppD [Piscinibacter sakaiensis]